MDFATVLDGLILLALVALLGVVFVRDVTSYTIPNSVVLAIVGLFVVACLLHLDRTDIPSHLLAGLVVLVPGWIMFQFRMFGGGDVKAWAALALWYGLENLAAMVVAIAVFGGCLGIVLLVGRWLVKSHPPITDDGRFRLRNIRMLQPKAPVPYGIAIALGTLVTIGRIPLFASLPLPS